MKILFISIFAPVIAGGLLAMNIYAWRVERDGNWRAHFPTSMRRWNGHAWEYRAMTDEEYGENAPMTGWG